MQGMTKTKVFVMFDDKCCTWNVMTADHECLYFGTADGVDDWLDENQERYQECDELQIDASINKVA